MLRRDGVERMEDCIPKDLRLCTNSKSNLHLHLLSRELHWAFSGGNSAQHAFGSDEYATLTTPSMRKILYISKMSSILKPSQLLSTKEQKPSVSAVAELIHPSHGTASTIFSHACSSKQILSKGTEGHFYYQVL